MKKGTKTILLTAALTLGLTAPAAAANVAVTLPDFPVTLNGTAIDNSYRQYPLLVYKNITYFPMTYYDCRFLGVETEWTQQNGLKIEKSSLTGAYHQQNATAKNSKTATAQIAAGKITVNGKSIHNSKEAYPLLSYRNVTYFPLTWRFAVDEFGWKYNFSSKAGLVIDAGNTKTSSINLKDAQISTEYEQFDFAVDKNYLYYQGQQGEIYQRPLNDWNNDKQRKTLLQVPKEDSYQVGYPTIHFQEQEGNVYLRYHSGGASFGGDYLYGVKNGKLGEELIERSYDEYVDFGDFCVQIAGTMIGGQPAVPMTYLGKDGTTKELGPDGYRYHITTDAYDKKRKLLYVSAANTEQNAKSYLYAVSLADNQLKQLSSNCTSNYEVADDYIYYLSYMKPDGTADANYSQRYLYSIDLKTGKETYIDYAGQSDADYIVLYAAADNGVYYRNSSTGSFMFYHQATGKRDILNDGFKVNLLTAQNGYVIAGFEEHPKSSCRLAVYQSTANGSKQVYGSADVSDKAVVNTDGLLVYRLNGSSQLVKVQL